jgi:hypothetical protein
MYFCTSFGIYSCRITGAGSYASKAEYREAMQSRGVAEGTGNGGYASGGCCRAHSRILSSTQPQGQVVTVTLVSHANTFV